MSSNENNGRTLQQLAQEVIDVQGACNLCGVAQAFARAMRDLGAHTSGTQARNTHPITKAWLEKMNQLAGMEDTYTALVEWNKIYDMAKSVTE